MHPPQDTSSSSGGDKPPTNSGMDPGEYNELLKNIVRIKRTPVACSECRKRQVKCSGGQPCERCKTRDLECHYVPLGPKPSNTLQSAPPQSTTPSNSRQDSLSGGRPAPIRLRSVDTITRNAHIAMPARPGFATSHGLDRVVQTPVSSVDTGRPRTYQIQPIDCPIPNPTNRSVPAHSYAVEEFSHPVYHSLQPPTQSYSSHARSPAGMASGYDSSPPSSAGAEYTLHAQAYHTNPSPHLSPSPLASSGQAASLHSYSADQRYSPPSVAAPDQVSYTQSYASDQVPYLSPTSATSDHGLPSQPPYSVEPSAHQLSPWPQHGYAPSAQPATQAFSLRRADWSPDSEDSNARLQMQQQQYSSIASHTHPEGLYTGQAYYDNGSYGTQVYNQHYALRHDTPPSTLSPGYGGQGVASGSPSSLYNYTGISQSGDPQIHTPSPSAHTTRYYQGSGDSQSDTSGGVAYHHHTDHSWSSGLTDSTYMYPEHAPQS